MFKFELELTTNFILKKCSERISNKYHEKKVRYIDIYPSDEAMICRIINNSRSKNNRYLLTDKIMRNNKNEFGIIPILGFKDEYEVLWGTDEEFKKNLPYIFHNIIKDLLDRHNLDIDIDNILCDYVPYAKFSTYAKCILPSLHAHLPIAPYYGICPEDIGSNLVNAQNNAIDFLYSKPNFKKEFNKSFSKFAQDTLTYTKIDKEIADKFVQPYLIPLLKKYAPSGDSLGLRAKNIIEHDLSQSKDLILAHEENRTLSDSEYKKALINASSSYIVKLEEIQKSFMYVHQ